MEKIIKFIPNILTSLNLVCGFIAIVFSFDVSTLQYAPYLIFIAACFDFSDGFAARALNAFSEFGKQLDSLADTVSFGVAPGVIVYQLLHNINFQDNYSQTAIILIACLVPVFSALRLAKFNIDERQTESFMGLPTPACAILIASIAIVAYKTTDLQLQAFLLNKVTLLIVVLSLSFLLISELPMFSMKFKNYSFKHNYVKYIFLSISFILVIVFKYFALPLIIVLYILMSVILYVLKINVKSVS
jgi:CDP-diacylglycerol---serine O-phosphatidyltransferase